MLKVFYIKIEPKTDEDEGKKTGKKKAFVLKKFFEKGNGRVKPKIEKIQQVDKGKKQIVSDFKDFGVRKKKKNKRNEDRIKIAFVHIGEK